MHTAKFALPRSAFAGDVSARESASVGRPSLLDRVCLLLERLADATSGICPFCWEAAQSGRWVEHLCPLEAGYPVI